MTATKLETGEVVLIPYSERHDASTVEWLNSVELRETFGMTQPVSLESHRAWIAASRNAIIWAISAGTAGHCGNVLLHCNDRHHSAYFQIYLGNTKARGRGIGRTALNLVLGHAFGPLRLHRVWLHTLPGNTAAERLYRSAGFIEEGRERDVLFRDGGYHSQYRWSLLAGEWRSGGGGDGQ